MRMKKPLIAAAVVSGAFGLGFGGAAVASAATTPGHASTTNVSVSKAQTSVLEESGTTGSTGSSSSSSSSSSNSSSTTGHKCPNMGSTGSSTSS
jgi:cytoskeletal protein RodZ